MIDAAAMEETDASPLITISVRTASLRSSRPSAITTSGGSGNCASARRHARRSAADNPISSNSDACTQPSAHCRDPSRICGASWSRCRALSSLLSRNSDNQAGRRPNGSETAAVTTGPASGPRPTSSRPTMERAPLRRCCSSRRRFGTCLGTSRCYPQTLCLASARYALPST